MAKDYVDYIRNKNTITNSTTTNPLSAEQLYDSAVAEDRLQKAEVLRHNNIHLNMQDPYGYQRRVDNETVMRPDNPLNYQTLERVHQTMTDRHFPGYERFEEELQDNLFKNIDDKIVEVITNIMHEEGTSLMDLIIFLTKNQYGATDPRVSELNQEINQIVKEIKDEKST